MKYQVLRPFIAFGKTPERGEYVDLTAEQAAALTDDGLVEPYETRMEPLPENKMKKKSLASRPAGRVSKKKTAKRSKKTVKKS